MKRSNEYKADMQIIESLNSYVKELLSDKQCIEAKDIEVKSFDDIVRILHLICYCANELVVYEIELRDDVVVKLNYEFANFVIKLKN